jgi:hypothetical protein
MNGRQRLRREDPLRTGPIRNWSTLYRRPDSWDFREPSATPMSAEEATRRGSWNDAVAQGVELGYRVVEEQIRHGQRVAEQINKQSYDPGAIGNDIREVAERMLRYYADLSALWFELLGSLIGNTGLPRGSLGPGRPTPEPFPMGGSASGPPAVSIEVVSSRPTRTTLDLRPPVDGSRLSAQDLRASGSGKPPLTDVAFEPVSDGGLVLRIRVPETQPPGIYTGAVIDRDTGQPRGTLSVSLAEQPESGARRW